MAPRALGIALLTVLLFTGSATADEAVSGSLGLRSWVTSGYTKWNFSGLGVDPLSELRWRGTDAVIVEGSTDVVWKRLVFMLSLGGGRPDDGVLIDDDFLASNRQARFSHTRSLVDGGSIFYVNGDVGYRAFQWQGPQAGTHGFVDFFVGYQYWHEEYEAIGGKGVFLGVIPIAVPNGTEVITHEYSFSSVRVGGRARVPIWKGLALRGSAVLLPYTHTELEDRHHLRTDLRQDPSFSSTGDGGFGVQLDAGLTFTVWKGLSIDAGYQFWRIDSGSGTKTTFGVSGTSRDRLGDIIIERGGPYFGVTYRY
jgi:hypothetical protein